MIGIRFRGRLIQWCYSDFVPIQTVIKIIAGQNGVNGNIVIIHRHTFRIRVTWLLFFAIWFGEQFF